MALPAAFPAAARRALRPGGELITCHGLGFRPGGGDSLGDILGDGWAEEAEAEVEEEGGAVVCHGSLKSLQWRAM